MRLMFKTLKKDARHLLPAAIAIWMMLAVLANADRWRSDLVPSSIEGWMNPLLSMAWACLTALAVLEEPLVGSRNFWTTRPFQWFWLLLAKLAFVALAIHLPSLLADVFVLAQRGFSPVEYIGDLLWKQFLFLGAITLPAIALASLVRSFTHFVIALFVVAAGIAMLNGGFQSFPQSSSHENDFRHATIWITLAFPAAAVIWAQYARRRLFPGQIMATAAVVAAISVFLWLPTRAGYAAGIRSQKSPRITLRSAADQETPSPVPGGEMRFMVPLPIAIDNGTSVDRFRIPIIDIDILLPDGSRLKSTHASPNRPFERIDLFAAFFETRSTTIPQTCCCSSFHGLPGSA